MSSSLWEAVLIFNKSIENVLGGPLRRKAKFTDIKAAGLWMKDNRIKTLPFPCFVSSGK